MKSFYFEKDAVGPIGWKEFDIKMLNNEQNAQGLYLISVNEVKTGIDGGITLILTYAEPPRYPTI